MLVSQDFAGVRAERAERQGIRKSKNKKERSPTVAACRRTPPAQLATQLCHLVVEKKPDSQMVADEQQQQQQQDSIANGASPISTPAPKKFHPSVLCGDGLHNFEKEIRVDYFQYMLEKDKSTRPNIENMEQQPEVRWDMRTLLVDFLVLVHGHFGLRSETLHLAINLLDRYMSKAVVIKKHYQLVGMSCLWIAAKFEDGQEKVPRAFMLCNLSCYLYDEDAFATMERHVLKTLDWNIGHPTAETFLQCYLMFSSMDVSRVRHVARLLLEVTLYDACFLPFASHTIATSCLFAARRILGIPRGLLSDTDERLPCLRELEKSLRLGIPPTLFTKYNVHGNMRASLHVKNWLDSNVFTGITDELAPLAHLGVLSPVNFNIDGPFSGEADRSQSRATTPGAVCEERPLMFPRAHSLPPISSSRAIPIAKVEAGRMPR